MDQSETSLKLTKLSLNEQENNKNDLQVQTKAMKMSNPGEESKISQDDMTPNSAAGSGMDFDTDNSSKKSVKRISPMLKVSAYNVMEGKTQFI